jgi:hypothetical protein
MAVRNVTRPKSGLTREPIPAQAGSQISRKASIWTRSFSLRTPWRDCVRMCPFGRVGWTRFQHGRGTAGESDGQREDGAATAAQLNLLCTHPASYHTADRIIFICTGWLEVFQHATV